MLNGNQEELGLRRGKFIHKAPTMCKELLSTRPPTADEGGLQKTPPVLNTIVKLWTHSITNVKPLKVFEHRDDVITER